MIELKQVFSKKYLPVSGEDIVHTLYIQTIPNLSTGEVSNASLK